MKFLVVLLTLIPKITRTNTYIGSKDIDYEINWLGKFYKVTMKNYNKINNQ